MPFSDYCPFDGHELRPVFRNLLQSYKDGIAAAIDRLAPDPRPDVSLTHFNPGFALPEYSNEFAEYLSAAEAGWWPLGTYKGRKLALLDLMRNRSVQTTKTFASLLMVARAVAYIQRTGEAITIVCPTSGNKGIALRDAVERAIHCGLVRSDELNIALVMPALSQVKLRSSQLSNDPALAALNPVFLFYGNRADGVKVIASDFVRSYCSEYYSSTGKRLWYSLDIRNYRIADCTRAFFEADVCPVESTDARRLHVHSVSSGYGLLGYSTGRDIIESRGLSSSDKRPGFLMVQHLGTPDMVLSRLYDSFDTINFPTYTRDKFSGLYTQRSSLHFPLSTSDPEEVLDRTFYTRQPVTATEMNHLIVQHGGTGIVVSFKECQDRYPLLKAIMQGTDAPLPDNIDELTERSLVMALTGALNAIDRGLVEPFGDVVIHGSGSYSTNSYTPINSACLCDVNDATELGQHLLSVGVPGHV